MSVKKWVMSDEWWVMEIEWRKLSDEKCLTKQALSFCVVNHESTSGFLNPQNDKLESTRERFRQKICVYEWTRMWNYKKKYFVLVLLGCEIIKNK